MKVRSFSHTGITVSNFNAAVRFGRPERSPRGHTFFVVKDLDGNLIELMDLGRM